MSTLGAGRTTARSAAMPVSQVPSTPIPRVKNSETTECRLQPLPEVPRSGLIGVCTFMTSSAAKSLHTTRSHDPPRTRPCLGLCLQSRSLPELILLVLSLRSGSLVHVPDVRRELPFAADLLPKHYVLSS